MEFVRLGENKSARRAIAVDKGVNIRLVYRAVEKHLDWARAQMQKTPEGDANRGSDATNHEGSIADTTPRLYPSAGPSASAIPQEGKSIASPQD